jgi:hypothetical protein
MVLPRKSPNKMGKKKKKIAPFVLSIPLAILLGLMWTLHHRVSEKVAETHKQVLRPPPKFTSNEEEQAYDPPPPGSTRKKKNILQKLPPPLHPVNEKEDIPAVEDTPFRIFHESNENPKVEFHVSHPGEVVDPVVAYAISLVKCGDHQTNAAGLTDAALVLRHSIHMISSRNPESGSKYDYNMIAIVHRQAIECSKLLETVGFEIMVVDAPVQPEEIQGEHLRKHIHKEWCCGHGKCD